MSCEMSFQKPISTYLFAWPWAAWYNTWLLIKLMPKGIFFSFSVFACALLPLCGQAGPAPHSISVHHGKPSVCNDWHAGQSVRAALQPECITLCNDCHAGQSICPALQPECIASLKHNYTLLLGLFSTPAGSPLSHRHTHAPPRCSARSSLCD